jgi:hypothetical protein
MSVPSISTVTPSTGLTAGRTLVEITGSGFRLPPDPAPTGPVPPYPPTVAVLFGATPALAVKVLSSSLLTALTPASDAGAVSVTVKNLDDAGVPIPGEVATKAAGYAFARPGLAPQANAVLEPIALRVVKALVAALRRAVLDNVVLMVHTEYDDVPGGVEVAMLASLPALAVGGPEFVEVRQADQNEPPEEQVSDAAFRTMRPSSAFDLVFAITGAADSTGQLHFLLDATRDFFDRAHSLEIARDPADSSVGTVSYPMDVPLGPNWRVTSAPNEANVQTFTGSCVVRGVRREGAAGVAGDLRRERGGRTTGDGATIEVSRTEE